MGISARPLGVLKKEIKKLENVEMKEHQALNQKKSKENKES